MATQSKTQVTTVDPTTLAPPPVADGTEYRGSLGRWVDDLLGDRRIRESVREDLRGLISESIPDDPPPSEAPPPVPDGTDASRRHL